MPERGVEQQAFSSSNLKHTDKYFGHYRHYGALLYLCGDSDG